MFPLTKCSVPGCNAFTFRNTGYCFRHHPDQDAILSQFIGRLNSSAAIRDESIVNAEIRDVNVGKGASLVSSNFSFCVFDRCIFEDISMNSVFFDFSIFRDCVFREDGIRYSVFSGSTFANTKINDSTVLHSNFMGIDAESCDFSSNDFYFSNFSLSKLIDISMDDCNLKRTSFRSCIMKNVSLRYSNPEDAYFRNEEAHGL